MWEKTEQEAKVTPTSSPPSEANSHIAKQEIPLCMEPKVHYHIHNSLSLDPLLRQINPLHNLMPYFPYFEKIKGGLWDRLAVCMYPPNKLE
jgi:hypothetical protein